VSATSPAIFTRGGDFGLRRGADCYASGFNSELFRKHGVEYYYSDRTTSDYFGGFLPILMSRRCRLLDSKRLASQLARSNVGHPASGPRTTFHIPQAPMTTWLRRRLA
jgi:hypothetical protein